MLIKDRQFKKPLFARATFQQNVSAVKVWPSSTTAACNKEVALEIGKWTFFLLFSSSSMDYYASLCLTSHCFTLKIIRPNVSTWS